MSKWLSRFFAISAILGLVYCFSNPIIHYGICSADGHVGYCQHRNTCWEKNVNYSSAGREPCYSLLRSDIVCCRRAPPENFAKTLTQLFPQPDVCGSPFDDISIRIASGEVADIRDFPWMALLRISSDGEEYIPLCGGSLIHKRWVLTAAHCVNNLDSSQVLQVRLGEWNTSSSMDCQQWSDDKICAPPHIDTYAERIIVHERYAIFEQPAFNHKNDIALLRLNSTVRFTDFVLPICLPPPNAADDAYAARVVDIAGWGKLSAHSEESHVKMKAELNVWPKATCRQRIPQLLPGQICAGGDKRGTCKGDSGGPLMLLNASVTHNTYYLAGIISIGTQTCNYGERPMMLFTRVEHYVPWVITTVRENS